MSTHGKFKNKLKIGYVSPDFKRHSVKSFLLPTLAHHNHDKFEVFAFAELDKADLITEQYKSYVDHWIRTEKIKDDELVKKIRDLGIDILVDVAGHTKNNRLKVFAQKPAPISLTWLGFGYTTGLSAIDYFLTDKVMAPKGIYASLFQIKIMAIKKSSILLLIKHKLVWIKLLPFQLCQKDLLLLEPSLEL